MTLKAYFYKSSYSYISDTTRTFIKIFIDSATEVLHRNKVSLSNKTIWTVGVISFDKIYFYRFLSDFLICFCKIIFIGDIETNPGPLPKSFHFSIMKRSKKNSNFIYLNAHNFVNKQKTCL